jgi:hypothetical protein
MWPRFNTPTKSVSVFFFFFLCFGRSFIYLVVLGSFRRTVAGGRGSRQRRLEPAYWVWPLALVQRGSYRPTSAGTAFPPPPLLCALQRQRNRCALPESSSDNEARTHKAHDNAGSSIDPRRECESGYCDHDRPREETTQAEGDVCWRGACVRAREADDPSIQRSSQARRRSLLNRLYHPLNCAHRDNAPFFYFLPPLGNCRRCCRFSFSLSLN